MTRTSGARFDTSTIVRLRVLFLQPFADQGGTGGLALRRFEHFPFELLQVGRLGLDAQLIHRGNGNVVDQPQVDPQADARQQPHRLFGGNLPGVA